MGSAVSHRIGIVECASLSLYERFLRDHGYGVVHEPGTPCSVLVVSSECCQRPAVREWGRTLEAPKLVLGADPPADWRDATRVELPLLPISLEQRIAALEARGEPAPAARRRFQVTVVDDDPTILAAAEAALVGQGFRVETCDGFASLTGALLHGRPDFILLDLNLPGFSGQMVGSFIRSRGIPIAVFSSEAQAELDAAKAKIGAVAAFPKSTALPAVGQWIRDYLEKAR